MTTKPHLSHTISLSPPLKVEGKGTVEKLHLREPTGGEVLKAERSLRKGVDAITVRSSQAELIASVASLDIRILAEVPIRQISEATAYLDSFINLGAEAVTPEGDEYSIELDEPVTHRGVKYERIDLREPKLGDVRKAESHLRLGATADAIRSYQLTLVAAVSEIPYDAIEQFPISDLNKAGEWLSSFINAGRATGQI